MNLNYACISSNSRVILSGSIYNSKTNRGIATHNYFGKFFAKWFGSGIVKAKINNKVVYLNRASCFKHVYGSDKSIPEYKNFLKMTDAEIVATIQKAFKGSSPTKSASDSGTEELNPSIVQSNHEAQNHSVENFPKAPLSHVSQEMRLELNQLFSPIDLDALPVYPEILPLDSLPSWDKMNEPIMQAITEDGSPCIFIKAIWTIPSMGEDLPKNEKVIILKQYFQKNGQLDWKQISFNSKNINDELKREGSDLFQGSIFELSKDREDFQQLLTGQVFKEVGEICWEIPGIKIPL